MAAIQLSHHPLHTQQQKNPTHHKEKKPITRRTQHLTLLICRSQSSGSELTSKREKTGGGEEKDGKKTVWGLVVKLVNGEAERLGKGLRESLSPKQKGDWRDLMLMSFSFAVYVYISQKLVCTYCAWISMINHHT